MTQLYIHELEVKNRELREKNEKLEKEIEELKAENQALRIKNSQLEAYDFEKRRNTSYTASTSTSYCD